MIQDNLPITVGILIFDQVEVLDVAGPFEVFSVTRLNEKSRREESSTSPFRVLLVSEKLSQVLAIGGLRLTPDVSIYNCPNLDLLLVPGGWSTRKEVKNDTLLKWIADMSAKRDNSIGLHRLKSSWKSRIVRWTLREAAPKTKIRRDVLFTLTEQVFTSAGVSAGIDLALRIVSHFFGTEVGEATAQHMDIPYPQRDTRRSDT
jgi:transcriptional regulator GlxA family with amidase domain